MKFRCTTSTLLLLIALAAISCGAAVAWTRTGVTDSSVQWKFGGLEVGIVYLAVVSPFWLPIAFVAYAIGRKALTLRTLLALAFCEIASVSLIYVWFR
jgi:hypothetical protein